MEENVTVITTPSGEEYHGFPNTSKLNACICCGHEFDIGEPIVTCADCGAMFCRKCVENGDFSDHGCEDDDCY